MVIRPRSYEAAPTLPRQRDRDGLPPVAAPDLPLAPAPEPAPAPMPPRPSRQDVLAVEASLAAVRKRPVVLAETFYAHLFDIAPAARDMFAEDMTAQMQRMTDTLLATIAAVQAPEASDAPAATATLADQPALERSLHSLGAMHRDRFGVEPEHYLYIAHALTRAVRDVAGPAWSGSLSSSWIALTQWITGQMLAGHLAR